MVKFTTEKFIEKAIKKHQFLLDNTDSKRYHGCIKINKGGVKDGCCI